jgi:hypothetical protein
MCVQSQLSPEEVCDLMVPDYLGDGIVGVYKCFVDDSKDSQQAKMLVCAGWIGERNDWMAFCKRWNNRLTQDGIGYFKTSEYKMLKGEFEKFRSLTAPAGREAAREIRNDLLAIISSYEHIYSVGVCIPMDEWCTVSSRPEAKDILGHPYHRAIESVWFQTVKRGFRTIHTHRHSVVQFVHDEGPDSEELLSLYGAFKRLNPKTAKYLAGFACLDDKLNPPLQAADLIANHTLEIGIDWLDNGKSKVKELELQSSIGYLAVWNKHYARGLLCHELHRKKLPIPEDLLEEFPSYR